MIEDFFFREQLSQTKLRNNHTKYAFKDLFTKELAYISTSVEICRCVKIACESWDNYNPDNAVNLNNKNKDDKNKNMRKMPLEDPDKPYGIYNINNNLCSILINIYIDNVYC